METVALLVAAAALSFAVAAFVKASRPSTLPRLGRPSTLPRLYGHSHGGKPIAYLFTGNFQNPEDFGKPGARIYGDETARIEPIYGDGD